MLKNNNDLYLRLAVSGKQSTGIESQNPSAASEAEISTCVCGFLIRSTYRTLPLNTTISFSSAHCSWVWVFLSAMIATQYAASFSNEALLRLGNPTCSLSRPLARPDSDTSNIPLRTLQKPSFSTQKVDGNSLTNTGMSSLLPCRKFETKAKPQTHHSGLSRIHSVSPLASAQSPSRQMLPAHRSLLLRALLLVLTYCGDDQEHRR